MLIALTALAAPHLSSRGGDHGGGGLVNFIVHAAIWSLVAHTIGQLFRSPIGGFLTLVVAVAILVAGVLYARRFLASRRVSSGR